MNSYSNDAIDLAAGMASVKLINGGSRTPTKPKKRKAARKNAVVSNLPSGCPFLSYQWKDYKRNTLLTIEILMYGDVDVNRVKIDIEEKGRNGCQKIIISQPLPPSWLCMQHFKGLNDGAGKEAPAARHDSRTDHINELQHSYGHKLVTKHEMVLPFRCDDFNLKGAYDGTGTWFEHWPVEKIKVRKNGMRVNKIVGYVNVLTIQLVGEDKVRQEKIKTPKRRTKSRAYVQRSMKEDYDSSSSDDDADIDVSYSDDDSDMDDATSSITNQQSNISFGPQIGKSFDTANEEE